MVVRKIIFNKDINNYIYWYDISLVEYHQLVEENKIDKNNVYFINDSKELYLNNRKFLEVQEDINLSKPFLIEERKGGVTRT